MRLKAETPVSEFEKALMGEVKAWMGRRGVTQSQLAEVLGVTPSNMSKRLRGESRFPVRDLAAVAGFMGVSLGQLMGPVADAPIILDPGTPHDEDPAKAAAGAGSSAVRPVGLEPTTQGLKVPCSTN